MPSAGFEPAIPANERPQTHDFFYYTTRKFVFMVGTFMVISQFLILFISQWNNGVLNKNRLYSQLLQSVQTGYEAV
jgi:quinol-cytochrome oxidoreductase complex cytochrome b subunit